MDVFMEKIVKKKRHKRSPFNGCNNYCCVNSYVLALNFVPPQLSLFLSLESVIFHICLLQTETLNMNML